jgi:lupus La protein
LDGQKLEILYKPKYHELKAEEYKDSPIRSKKFSFNAFKPSAQINSNKHAGNKRKNNSGFAKADIKKTKANEDEAKEEEAKSEE